MGKAAPAIHRVHKLLMAARKELARRNVRTTVYDPDRFGEPAWDILLHLYVAAYEERMFILTKEAVVAANVPYTTALRWLNHLEQAGEIEKAHPSDDGRVTYVGLSGKGIIRVEQALSALIDAEVKVEARSFEKRFSRAADRLRE